MHGLQYYGRGQLHTRKEKGIIHCTRRGRGRGGPHVQKVVKCIEKWGHLREKRKEGEHVWGGRNNEDKYMRGRDIGHVYREEGHF